MSAKHRLLSKAVEDENGCWRWTGYITREGYGRFKMNRSPWRAHRAAYTLLVGLIPDGLDLDHLCRVRDCVNPDHLEPVTRSENLLRGYRARRAQC